MATFVNRQWCVAIDGAVLDCVVVAQDYANATMTVAIADGNKMKRVKVPARNVGTLADAQAIADKWAEITKRAEEAGKLGTLAFAKGINAPAQDKAIMPLLVGLQVGEGLPILDAWNKAWWAEYHKATAFDLTAEA